MNVRSTKDFVGIYSVQTRLEAIPVGVKEDTGLSELRAMTSTNVLTVQTSRIVQTSHNV